MSRLLVTRVLQLLFLSALSLCLLLPLTPCSAQAAYPTSITRVSGCTDSGSMTTLCLPPFDLTISGSGFLTLPSWSSVELRDPSSTAATTEADACFVTAVLNDSTLTCSLYAPPHVSLLPQSAVVDLVILTPGSSAWLDVSAPFPGLTLAYLPAPVFTSVSGCQGAGNATLLCVPDSDVLRLQGSGLLTLTQTVVTVDINRAYDTDAAAFIRSAPQPLMPAPFLQVLNDSEALLTLADVYGLALQVEGFGSGELPLTLLLGLLFSNAVYQTNAVYVSFAPLPAPIVTALSLRASGASSMDPTRGCQAVANSSTRVQGCDGGSSLLQLSGHYLYSPSILIGGQECAVPFAEYWSEQPQATQSRWCVVPSLPGPASTFYDLTVTTVAGQVTLSQAVSFTDAPVLTSISSCSTDAWFSVYIPKTNPGSFFPRCYAGSTVYLSGVNLLPSSTPFAIVLSAPVSGFGRTPVTAQCQQPTYINATTLSCVLPTPPAGFTAGGDSLFVQLQYPAINATSNWLTTSRLYDQPTAPRVTSVQGCDSLTSPSTSPLAVSGCRWGSTLTIQGSFLLGNTSLSLGGPNLVSYPSWGMRLSSAKLSSTQVVLTLSPQSLYALPNLPTPDADAVDDLTFATSLYFSQGGYILTSNAFFITFASALPVPALPSSDVGGRHSRATIVVAAVVPAVVLLVAVMAALWVRRRWQLVGEKRARSVDTDGGMQSEQVHEQASQLNWQSMHSDADIHSIELH